MSRSPSRSVCLLTNAYPDFPDSNRTVFIRDLARLLAGRGCKVSVVAPRVFPQSRPKELEGAIEIDRFPSFLNGKLLVEYPKTPALRLVGYMLSGLLSTIAHVRRNKCHLIHAHWVVPAGLLALIAGRICRIPVIVTAHGSDILVIPNRNPLLKGLAKFVLTHADALTSVAEHITARIRQMGVQREILTFPMSVPADSFTPEGAIANGADAEKVIFSNRSLYPIYDVQLLVKAAPAILKKFPEVAVHIAGKGPELDSLKALANQLHVSDKVCFLGEIPHEEIPKYLRGAAAYVSTALSDGASVSLLEAMACGAVPVVADIPANREWIADGENGYLFPPSDARALAEKIEHCLTDSTVRQKARETNVQIVRQRAQWNLNVDKLLDLYEKVMTRR